LPQGGGRATLTNEDIAHALGTVKCRRAQMITMAIAIGDPRDWAKIQELAYPKLIRELLADRKTRQLVAGANKFRARLVLHDAFHDMVEWRQANWRTASQRCVMRQADYKDLYRAVSGFLRTEAAGAAHTAMIHLFNRG
jgi:hypothetical protein